MNRRELMALTASAASHRWHGRGPRAQQRRAKIPRVGIIDDGPVWNSFRQALREAGYVDGQTIAFEYRVADGKPEGLAAAAAELARLPVDVIAIYGTPAGRAAKAATTTIPIVTISVGDPVRAGLVQNLARPGGNVTGNTILGADLGPKRLQLLKEMIPSASRVAFLWNPDNESNVVMRDELRAAAPGLGLDLITAEARGPGDFARHFDDPERAGRRCFDDQRFRPSKAHRPDPRVPDAEQAAGDVPDQGQRRGRRPDVLRRELSGLFRHGAFLRAENPARHQTRDLPVRTPERFELIINLKTAKAIGREDCRIRSAARRRSDRMKRGKHPVREDMECARLNGCCWDSLLACLGARRAGAAISVQADPHGRVDRGRQRHRRHHARRCGRVAGPARPAAGDREHRRRRRHPRRQDLRPGGGRRLHGLHHLPLDHVV